jgi:hypothetical protein
MVILGVLVAIALIIGLFFAFSGSNPLVYHVANVIDMILVAITVLFVMGIMYMMYIRMMGGKPLFTPSKPASKLKNDDIPELAELIDNLDANN